MSEEHTMNHTGATEGWCNCYHCEGYVKRIRELEVKVKELDEELADYESHTRKLASKLSLAREIIKNHTGHKLGVCGFTWCGCGLKEALTKLDEK